MKHKAAFFSVLVLMCMLLQAQHGKPDFKSTVQYIQGQVNRNSNDTATFMANQDRSFSIGNMRSNFYYLCKPRKNFCDSLGRALSIKKDGAYYHLVMYRPHEEYFATFKDYQYAELTLKALTHLMTLCQPPQEPF